MAQRRLGAVRVGALLVSASYGVAFLLGSGEMAVHSGMAGSLYAIVTALGMLALALTAGKLWHAGEPIWGVFGHRYGPMVRKLVAILSLVWMSGVLAAQVRGSIAVLEIMGLSASDALLATAAVVLAMTSIDVSFAAALFAFFLIASNLALLYVLVETRGLPLYIHAWPLFIREVSAAPRPETLSTIIAIGFLVITGSDYQQFVIAARRPTDARLGCVLASAFLALTAFLPAATIVAARYSGRLSGLTDPAGAIPWLMLHSIKWAGPPCIGVIVLAALGSGTAVTRAMTSALSDLHSNAKRYEFAYRILTITIGCAIASDGQSIISTIVSLNIIYVSAVGLLFVTHQTGWQIAPRCAILMLLSGAIVSAIIVAMSQMGIATFPDWMPLTGGGLVTICALLGGQLTSSRSHIRS